MFFFSLGPEIPSLQDQIKKPKPFLPLLSPSLHKLPLHSVPIEALSGTLLQALISFGTTFSGEKKGMLKGM